jgi:hypothetical protein
VVHKGCPRPQPPSKGAWTARFGETLSPVVGVVGLVGVVGGSGGVGASTFAAALAEAAAPSVLLDLDPVGGGIDVLLGIEAIAGARWSGLRVDGGHLDPALLRDGLPRWRSVAVLAADVEPSPAAALQVVEAAGALGPVVLDLPRGPAAARDALAPRCALCVLVAVAEVRELAAARAVIASLPGAPVGVVLRRGSLSSVEATAWLGVPLLGVLPPLTRPSGPPRVSARVAAGVLDGLAAPVVAGRPA